MANFEAPGEEGDEDRPGVDSVRLKGRHLASHRDACQLIIDGRRMLDVEVLLRYLPDRRSSYLVPVRVGLAEDHASVLTGLTEDATAVLSDLHQLLVKKVRTALEREVDTAAVGRLATQIAERARQPEPVARPDILAPREARDEVEAEETAPDERAA